ncbi:MAG: anti-sigma factor family protein [Solirubrobacteraceae bacterium]
MRLFTRKPLPIECRQVVELVTAYLEGTLEPREHRRLEAHLAACPHCLDYLEQIRETIAISGALEPDALSDDAVADLTRVFRAWSSGA